MRFTPGLRSRVGTSSLHPFCPTHRSLHLPTLSPAYSLTNANMVLATVRVKLAESDPEPKQKLDEGEHIIKRVVEVSELYNVLQGGFSAQLPGVGIKDDQWLRTLCSTEYNEKGFTVDARLAHWAIGWHMAVRADKK